ncbi:hypothetical protein [Nocardia sp. NPDC003963]
MGTNVNQVPDDMRGRADRNRRVVPGLNSHAEGDPDFPDLLSEGAGLGAYGLVLNVRDRLENRRKGWTGIADRYDGAGDAGSRGATDFEYADTDGGAGVSRKVDEV